MTADRPPSSAAPEDVDEGSEPPTGSLGEELALLLQVLAEQSTVKHPLVQVVRDRPQLIEHAADTLVSWVRGAQETVTEASRGRT
ncbi:hypothetical protein [Aeromicrobium sp. CTD01-1L150]|uniref:hypothetical protein n=1 Tax=Aeromicrobium sp. CTD01-1L150 TaxID=3341830 RepID=UPI0035C0FA4C